MNPLMTGITNRGAQIVAAWLAAIILLPTVAHARADFFTVCGKQVSLNQDRFVCENERNLGRLAKLTKLRELTIEIHDMENWEKGRVLDVAFLAKLTRLKRLMLSTLRRVDLRHIAGLSRLASLEVYSEDLVDLGPIAGLRRLKTLRLLLDFIRRRPDLSPIGKLTALRFLYLRIHVYPMRFPIRLEPLGNLTQLECLGIRGMGVIDDLRPLTRLAKLRSFSLFGVQVKSLAPLSKLVNLEGLSLSHTSVSDLSPLSQLKRLSLLEIDGTRVVDLRPLRSLSGLQTLRVQKSPVSDLTPIVGLTGLRQLQLDSRQIRKNLKLLRRLDKERPQLRVSRPILD